ncbi:MAG: formate dehydrogenase accessory sulfurtransferase FdhD [Desulfurococcales archaeon]|nr:formate dehydrogenase accessory sulfurtransferase FdhD [Desulfurococcales archaeon]
MISRGSLIEAKLKYVTINGVNVAVDRLINVYVNGEHYTTLVGSPSSLEEAGLGIAVSDLLIEDPSLVSVDIDGDDIHIHIKSVDNVIEGRKASIEDCGILNITGGKRPNGALIEWSRILEAIKDFSGRTASRAIGVAAHSVGLYDESAKPLAIVHDTSRHTAALKLVGIIAKLKIKPYRHMVVTTGRASSDIVVRLGMAGVPVIVTLRGPLDSGVRAASRIGVTLVANSRIRGVGRRFVVLTNVHRVKGYTSNGDSGG